MPNLINNDLIIMAFYKHVIVSVVNVSKLIRGPPSNHGGGVKFLSRTKDLFQPSSAAG